jgi:hypothetical protein
MTGTTAATDRRRPRTGSGPPTGFVVGAYAGEETSMVGEVRQGLTVRFTQRSGMKLFGAEQIRAVLE